MGNIIMHDELPWLMPSQRLGEDELEQIRWVYESGFRTFELTGASVVAMKISQPSVCLLARDAY